MIKFNLDAIKKMVGQSKVSATLHTYEKIGDTIFPVTHFNNGIVIIDYPDQPPTKKENK